MLSPSTTMRGRAPGGSAGLLRRGRSIVRKPARRARGGSESDGMTSMDHRERRAAAGKFEAEPAPVNRPLLEARGLCKTYRTGDLELSVLRGVSLSVGSPARPARSSVLRAAARRRCSVSAPGWMRRQRERAHLTARRWRRWITMPRAALRNRLVGFVFQNFQLIPTLTALENVLVPLELRGGTRARGGGGGAAREARARRSGSTHYPLQLSGGRAAARGAGAGLHHEAATALRR